MQKYPVLLQVPININCAGCEEVRALNFPILLTLGSKRADLVGEFDLKLMPTLLIRT